MTGVARMAGVALEAADPMRLAEFYRDLTGVTIVRTDPDWITLETPGGGTPPCVQRAPGHQPARWPDPASSMQSHIDFEVEVPPGLTRRRHPFPSGSRLRPNPRVRYAHKDT